jgi:streptogramin lyase
MSLDNAPILVMCWDAPTAHALVNVISAARGDVVYAANTGEAMQRLQQFSFDAAVLCWQTGPTRCSPERPTPQATPAPSRL